MTTKPEKGGGLRPGPYNWVKTEDIHYRVNAAQCLLFVYVFCFLFYSIYNPKQNKHKFFP